MLLRPQYCNNCYAAVLTNAMQLRPQYCSNCYAQYSKRVWCYAQATKAQEPDPDRRAGESGSEDDDGHSGSEPRQPHSVP
eukprot:1399728-Rhodomonas_salina.1